MSLRKDQGLRVALAGLSCLLCACSSGEQTPDASTAGGGGVSVAGGGTSSGGTAGASTAGGGTAGAATGGAASGGGPPATGGTPPVGGNAGAGGTIQAGGASGAGSAGTAGAAGGSATFTLTSPALDNVAGCALETPRPCDVFPDENVAYMGRANISPELRWTGVPPGTQSFALVLLDVTYGQAHWALWNIPASATMLAANVPQDTANPATPAGSRQANANFATEGGEHGYFGPHTPCNVFQFELFALSSSTFSPMDPDSAVLVSIELHELSAQVLGVAKLTGRSNDYMMTCE